MKFVSPSSVPVKVAKNRKLKLAEILHENPAFFQCGKKNCLAIFIRVHEITKLS